MRAAFSGKPRWSVTSRCAGTVSGLILLRIGLASTVVQTSDNDWPINVAVQEVDQYFTPNPRHRYGAPVGSSNRCQRRGNPHPRTGTIIGWRACLSIRSWMGQTAVTLVITCCISLPVKLHLDAMVPVRVNDGAWRTDYDGSLLPQHRRPRMYSHPMPVNIAAAIRDLPTNCINAVPVERTLSTNRSRPMTLFAWIDAKVRLDVIAQRFCNRGAKFSVEVIVRQMRHPCNSKGARLVVLCLVQMSLPT